MTNRLREGRSRRGGKGALTVVVVARRPLFRAAVQRVLEAEAAFTVVGSVTDAADAAASVIATNPAVVLLEPPDDREHLAAHVELVGAAGRCVIVFTSRAGIDDAYARASGAAALIPKSIHPDELPAAILDIHDAVAAALT